MTKVLLVWQHSVYFQLLTPLYNGLCKRKDIVVDRIKEETPEDIKKYDVIITWAYNAPLAFRCKKYSKNYIIAERAYLGDRKWYTSVAAKGLNGRGVFSIIDQHTSERREEHFPDLFNNYNSNYDPDGHIIIAGQVLTDRALMPVPHEIKNYSSIIRTVLERFPNRKVIFREHPKMIREKKSYNINIPPGSNVVIDKNKNLEDTLKGAKALVTINSNAGLLARIAGLEVYDYDRGSMAYSVNKRINEEWWEDKQQARVMIEKLCDNIAHYQYTPDEVLDGVPWDTISKLLI